MLVYLRLLRTTAATAATAIMAIAAPTMMYISVAGPCSGGGGSEGDVAGVGVAVVGGGVAVGGVVGVAVGDGDGALSTAMEAVAVEE